MQTNANTSVASQSHDVETWGAWVSRANNAYIGFLTLTVIATVLIVAFNNRLNKAKDEAYAREKQASDEKVATAGAVAAQANERAEKLEGENLTLRGQVATLETRSADAKKDVAVLQSAASDAKAAQQRVEIELAKARMSLEAERLTRLQLQRSVTQRMVPMIDGTRSNFSSLKAFKGTRVVFRYAVETGEPGNFAGGLGPFAVNSGWEMLGNWWLEPARKGELADGVTVEAYVGPNGETDSSSAAADAFAELLKNNGIDGVRRLPAKRGTLPPNSVRVLVGQIPDPFLKHPPK